MLRLAASTHESFELTNRGQHLSAEVILPIKQGIPDIISLNKAKVEQGIGKVTWLIWEEIHGKNGINEFQIG